MNFKRMLNLLFKRDWAEELFYLFSKPFQVKDSM